MALSVDVIKKDVVTNQKNLYQITLELVLTDTDGAGFTKQYALEYRTGETIATKKAWFVEEMQRDISRYKAAKTLSNNAALATAISEIKSALVV